MCIIKCVLTDFVMKTYEKAKIASWSNWPHLLCLHRYRLYVFLGQELLLIRILTSIFFTLASMPIPVRRCGECP